MNKTIVELLENIKKQNEFEGIGYFKTPLSNEDINKLLDYINNKEQEIERLNERIDKAIDLLKYKKGLFTKDVVQTKVIEDLLEILKGSDKEC